jgi:hypothetical protein
VAAGHRPYRARTPHLLDDDRKEIPVPYRRLLAVLATSAFLTPVAGATAQSTPDGPKRDAIPGDAVSTSAISHDRSSGDDPDGGATVTDHVIASFDEVELEATLFLPPAASADDPVPLVLRTHGWAGSRETSASGTLQRLLDEGYAVLTWDSRGFGCSGGVVRIDDPDTEGRDVTALIDWALDNAPIATEGDDPVVGMTGGSYAGGIQTAGAAVDNRLDALAPRSRGRTCATRCTPGRWSTRAAASRTCPSPPRNRRWMVTRAQPPSSSPWPRTVRSTWSGSRTSS